MNNPRRYPERDAEIWAARKTGRTLRDIGAEFGLGADRIRQICSREERLGKEIQPEQWQLDTPLLKTPIGPKWCLYYAGVKTVADLLTYTGPHPGSSGVAALLRLPNMGRKSVDAIQAALAVRSWKLREIDAPNRFDE